MKKIRYSEITPEKVYRNRRYFIKSIGLSAASIAMTSVPFIKNAYANNENKLTSFKDITTYNNYYEFGTSKSDPYINSQIFKTKPWHISIEGEVKKPLKLSMEEISEMFISEERIYRLRCVEGWSMVIPWMGFSLSKLLLEVNPTNKPEILDGSQALVTNNNGHPRVAGNRVTQFNWHVYKDILGYSSHPTEYKYWSNGLTGASLHFADSSSGKNHGTHVAGTVAGNTQGWARDSNIYYIHLYIINSIYFDKKLFLYIIKLK